MLEEERAAGAAVPPCSPRRRRRRIVRAERAEASCEGRADWNNRCDSR